MKSPHDAIAAGQIAATLVILVLFIWAARASRTAVAGWFRPSLGHTAARYWHVLAIIFFVVVAASQIYGAVAARYSVVAATILTFNVIIALLLLQTLLLYVVRQPEVAAMPEGGEAAVILARQAATRLGDLIARCVRVAALIGAAVIIGQTWIVNVLALVDATGWAKLTRSSITAGLTLFIAFIAWEVVKFVTARYVAKQGGGGIPGENAQEGGGSRLGTLMPLVRVALAITIGVLAILIVLSDLGVNITPLIAGASVFGLAISFGSQTLVRDIVSGVFYLSDDAFRVGEYIDCGKAKGTVEGFTLRSIKLRHQNGQVHTIPFGQLGQITNFSRDWATVKFNLRVARDTDIEKLRKTVKKIGLDMLEDPELKNRFIEPLKLQGVADITDNALIVRLKFTVQPQKPSLVQRQAIKRLISAFAENRIEFAGGTVAPQMVVGPVDTAAAGAAGAPIALRGREQTAAAAAAAGA